MADLPPMQCDANSVDQISSAVKRGGNLRMLPGTELIFSDSILPPASVPGCQVRGTATGAMFKGLNPQALRNGLVTYRMLGNERFGLDSLQTINFSHPVKVNRLLRNYYLAVTVENMPERDFLDYLARACGGHLRTSGNTWTLEPNAAEFKRRLLNLWVLREKQEPNIIKDAGNRLATLQTMRLIFDYAPPEYLVKALENEDTGVNLSIPAGSDIHNRLTGFFASLDPGSGFPLIGGLVQTPTGPLTILGSESFTATLHGDFTLDLSFPALDEAGERKVAKVTLAAS